MGVGNKWAPNNPILKRMRDSARDDGRRVFLSVLEYNPKAKVLDLGCNIGDFSEELAQKVGVPKIIGVDLERSCSPIIDLCVCDLNGKLPFKDGEFDVICASHIIEHLSETDTFLREIRRLLSLTGYAVIQTPNLAAWHVIFWLMCSKQPTTAAISDELGLTYKERTHRRIFTLSGLIRLLKYHGFIIEKSLGSTYYPLWGVLARMACYIDKWHSAYITVKVRK